MKIKQSFDHIQGAMSHTVYGRNLTQYRSQINEYVVEYGEIQAEFDLILSNKDFSHLNDARLKAQNLLKMIREHPMYLTLKDIVFDLYCKNPRTIDSKVAAAPNLTFLYESGIESSPPANCINQHNLNPTVSDRKEFYQSYDKLSIDSKNHDEELKKDKVKKLKVMTIDELKAALISYGVDKKFNGTD